MQFYLHGSFELVIRNTSALTTKILAFESKEEPMLNIQRWLILLLT
jgi:hypothetical protein